MYFEDELGIKPADLLRWPALDDFLAQNRFAPQPWEAAAAGFMGTHLSQFRVMFAMLLSIAVGFAHRYVPTATGRHAYSIATGLALLYYPFGNQVVLCLLPSAVMYGVMLATPRLAGRLAWLVSFPFMLLCMERAGDVWDRGEVDVTGSLMVLALKLVAVAHNVTDGTSRRADRFGAEKRALLLTRPPGTLSYLSYIFASGNLLAGPFFEYADYDAFIRRQGPWRDACRPRLLRPAAAAAARCVGTALVTLAVYLALGRYFSPFDLTAPRVWQLSMAARYGIALATAIGVRSKFYFIWGLSEAGINASGFGFNGFSDPEKKAPRFDKYKNTDVIKVETCTSLAAVPRFWNVNTGVFLRRYVYERVGGGFAGLAASQLVSALWHGLREGFAMFFIMSIFMLQASKVVYKQEKRLPAAVVNSMPWQAAKWVFAHTQLDVFCQPFSTQKWALCWSTFQAFHFVPHISAIAVTALGFVLPVPKAAPSSSQGGAAPAQGNGGKGNGAHIAPAADARKTQ